MLESISGSSIRLSNNTNILVRGVFNWWEISSNDFFRLSLSLLEFKAASFNITAVLYISFFKIDNSSSEIVSISNS